MIDILDVHFSFGTRRVLEGVSLQCAPGEIVGLVGRSGVGKSTVLHLLAGALKPESGTVLIDGRSPSEAVNAQRIGCLFQSPTLLPWASVAQNVAMPLQLGKQKVPHGEIERRVSQALDRASLCGVDAAFPAQLSGGMQTRAAIARAIVGDPDVLLLDEPFGALDDLTKEALYVDIQHVARRCATILVTHTLPEVLLLCDRVLVIRADDISGTASIVQVLEVPFSRPRTPILFEDPAFLRLHRALREWLL
jgi:NitT/TauT family transport system ATP-binding protein